MSKQTAIVIVGAVALFAVALLGALAFTGGDSNDGGVHTMPSGQTMTDPMHTMPGAQTMTGMTHSSP